MTGNLRLIAAAMLFLALPSHVALAQSPVAVMVGGSADFDACQTLSKVRGLRAGGDNFLSVRIGPGTGFVEKDRLGNGHLVYDCTSRGAWIGIVYGARGGQDCGVSSPVARRQAYRGRCRSGWVHRNFLTDVAG